MKKKIIVCGLVVAIIVTFMGFLNILNAAEVPSITSRLSKNSIEKGRNFSLTVSASKMQEGFVGIAFTLNYDTSKLELIDYSLGDLWELRNIEDFYSIVTKNYEVTTSEGDILTFNFKAKEGIEATTANISLEKIEIVKDDYTVQYANNSSNNIEIIEPDITPPTLTVKYSINQGTKTNKNVTATVEANEEIQALSGWTLSTDKRKLTKTYSQNTSENISVKDLAGNVTNKTITITNIDKVAPTILNESHSNNKKTNKNVTVTLETNEEVQALSEWTLSTDKRKLTKTYSQNTSENITIKDLAGNETKRTITITNIGFIGDLNNNDIIESNDLLKMLRYHAYIRSSNVAQKHSTWNLSDKEKKLADTNGNGSVDPGDVLVILRYLAASNSQKIAEKHPAWLDIGNQ